MYLTFIFKPLPPPLARSKIALLTPGRRRQEVEVVPLLSETCTSSPSLNTTNVIDTYFPPLKCGAQGTCPPPSISFATRPVHSTHSAIFRDSKDARPPTLLFKSLNQKN